MYYKERITNPKDAFAIIWFLIYIFMCLCLILEFFVPVIYWNDFKKIVVGVSVTFIVLWAITHIKKGTQREALNKAKEYMNKNGGVINDES